MPADDPDVEPGESVIWSSHYTRKVYHKPGGDGEPVCGTHLREYEWVEKAFKHTPLGLDPCKRCFGLVEKATYGPELATELRRIGRECARDD